MNTPGETCKLGSENTSWIRKYHKYDEMDRKIRNCDIFSTECKKLDGNAQNITSVITKFAELQVLEKKFFSSKKHHTIVRNHS